MLKINLLSCWFEINDLKYILLTLSIISTPFATSTIVWMTGELCSLYITKSTGQNCMENPC